MVLPEELSELTVLTEHCVNIVSFGHQEIHFKQTSQTQTICQISEIIEHL